MAAVGGHRGVRIDVVVRRFSKPHAAGLRRRRASGQQRRRASEGGEVRRDSKADGRGRGAADVSPDSDSSLTEAVVQLLRPALLLLNPGLA